jgi:hypothetical protein
MFTRGKRACPASRLSRFLTFTSSTAPISDLFEKCANDSLTVLYSSVAIANVRSAAHLFARGFSLDFA